MEEVGVELIVQGLSQFTSDIGKAKSALVDMVPGGDLVSNMFSSLGNVISGIVGGALHVLEYTLGNLISDAIEGVISAIKRLIAETIQAGSEFQTLSIRLNGLNMQDAINSGKSYTDAMTQAVAVTKDQMNWLQQLSAATPFDATSIANAYTLARSYGFADDEARKLTKDITDFAAGMGLGNEHIERVITNLGQMVQRGKITSTEMRDLARGAFLPLEDVLDRVAKNMGVTKAALTDMISTKEGVPAEQFVKAFEQMVEEEPHFIGAAGRLGRTFEAANNNVLDMVRSIAGLNIVKPVLDVLGEHVASLVDEFVSFNAQGELIHTDRWDKLVEAASNFGKALSGVIESVLGLLPSTEGFADAVISGLNQMADWLNAHKGDIVAWVQNAAQWINTTLVPAIINLKNWLFGINNPNGGMEQKGALQTLAEGAQVAAQWIGGTLVPFIQNALLPALATLWPLAVAIGNVLIAAFTGEGHDIRNVDLTDWITGTLIPAIKNLTSWIDKNRGMLSMWVRGFALVWAIAIIGAAVLGTLISILMALAGIVAGVVSAIIVGLGVALLYIIFWVATTYTKFVVWAINFYTSIFNALHRAQLAISDWAANTLISIGNWITSAVTKFTEFASKAVTAIKNAFANANWSSILDAIVNPLLSFDWVSIGVQIIQKIISGFTSIPLPPPSGGTIGGGPRPSPFAEGTGGWLTVPVGYEKDNYPIRLTSGERFAVIPKGQAAMPAAPASNTVNASQQIVNYFNLTIHSSARTEPIVQDFGMMQSMIGKS